MTCMLGFFNDVDLPESGWSSLSKITSLCKLCIKVDRCATKNCLISWILLSLSEVLIDKLFTTLNNKAYRV